MYVLRVLVYPDLCACMYSEYICMAGFILDRFIVALVDAVC